jgi:hypothetical protein
MKNTTQKCGGVEVNFITRVDIVAFHPSRPMQIPLIPNITTSALKMETLYFSETLVSTYESTWRQNPEQQILILLCHFYSKQLHVK